MLRRIFIFFKTLFNLCVYKLIFGSNLNVNGRPISLPSSLIIREAHIKMGQAVNILSETVVAAVEGGKLSIGDATFINRNCIIVCRGRITIGNGCRFGPNVCIYDHDHVYNQEGVVDQYKVGEIIIGNSCWIGANVTILRNTKIGDGCIIGAGTIVKGEIPPHTLVHPSTNIVLKPIHAVV